jgi:hypothetical protein
MCSAEEDDDDDDDEAWPKERLSSQVNQGVAADEETSAVREGGANASVRLETEFTNASTTGTRAAAAATTAATADGVNLSILMARFQSVPGKQ